VARPDWLKKSIAVGSEFHYKKQPRTRHNLINLGSLLALALAFSGVMALGAILPTAIYLPVAIFLMGPLIYGLFILVLHECSHVMFVLLADHERSERVNHQIGAAFGNILFTDYIKHWQEGHVVHHLKPTEPEDRQNPDPLDGMRLVRRYLFLLVPVVGPLLTNPSAQYGFSAKRMVLGIGFWGGIAWLGATLIHWHVALAILLAFQFTSILNFTKIAQEHASGLATEPDPFFRSRTYFYGTRYLTSPFFINYHFEHHANFKVPWYLLPAYHERVLALMPTDLQPYFLTRGWREFFAQLAGKRPLPPAAVRHLMGDAPAEVTA
jgi:fatty acid desaturase